MDDTQQFDLDQESELHIEAGDSKAGGGVLNIKEIVVGPGAEEHEVVTEALFEGKKNPLGESKDSAAQNLSQGKKEQT